jgi:2-polyprenyl-3-methyl-5-hydroxy-6-metoxy-1,4-benzoquinol methylase
MLKKAGDYRNRMYGNYVTVQVPGWLKADRQADATMERATLHRLRNWLPQDRNAKCLDLGCGAGPLMLTLRAAGYRNVYGVDVSPESSALARSKGLDVLEADVREFLHQGQDRFDLICAFDIVEHFRKDELLNLLDLIWERLVPGGALVFQTPNAVSPWASHYRYHDLTHELILDPDCATSLLTLTGFKEIEVREVAPFVHEVKSAVRWDLWRMIRGGCALWNLAETGGLCGNVYSRNMMVKAIKHQALS